MSQTNIETMLKTALTVCEQCRIVFGGVGVSNLFVVEQVYELCCKQVLNSVNSAGGLGKHFIRG